MNPSCYEPSVIGLNGGVETYGNGCTAGQGGIGSPVPVPACPDRLVNGGA